MDKRISVRIPVNIDMFFYLWSPVFWKNLYKGKIKNLSEQGLNIHTKPLYIPRDALLEIYIPFMKSFICIPSQCHYITWRRTLSDNSCDSFGLEIISPPQNYKEFIESLERTSWS